jgi:hypothetical protein
MCASNLLLAEDFFYLAVGTLPPGHVCFFFQLAPVTQQHHSGVVTSIVSKALISSMNAIDFQNCHFQLKHFLNPNVAVRILPQKLIMTQTQ